MFRGGGQQGGRGEGVIFVVYARSHHALVGFGVTTTNGVGLGPSPSRAGKKKCGVLAIGIGDLCVLTCFV
jgi:hypothetical protein